ncbi:MAG: peroxide stress protein YaaA [Clostridiales bacterium]|jgi:cytoplasmic iron level regulating protein YaaA (DUF328/UPF0246 family)|nr:peroxide stress protein YaaA [Clostridiales bacterium]
MIAILSPAKNMRPVIREGLVLSRPRYLEQTSRLADILRGYDAWELESMMKINPELGMKAYWDFQDFRLEAPGTAAALAYRGLAYQHLAAQDFTLEELAFANDHLRILSGFYGMLRACDGILPYRLEMQCKLKVDGKNLYGFWGDRLYQDLFASKQPVINLASTEYSKVISPYLQSQDRWITCQFLVNRGGKWKALATDSKMARGEMARYLIQNRLEQPEELQEFTWQGYRFAPLRSDDANYVFTREYE